MAHYKSNGCPLSSLWAVNCARQPVISMFMDKNAFRGAPFIDVYTAASTGDYDVIYHVLNSENGRLLMKNISGWTPLMYACYNDHDKIVELLISWGVDRFDCNGAGETPLMLAALNGNEKMLALVYKDNIINMTDKRGWSALFHAVSRRRQNAVAFLLEHGADVNLVARDNGYTVLMVAAATGKISVVKMLLAAGCNPSKVSWEGESAISIAHSCGFFDIVRMLSSSARFCELHLIDLHNLLCSLDLMDYWPLFQMRNIDMETFFSFTENNLKDIGVTRLGPRKKMASTISQWRQQRRPSHAQLCPMCHRQYL
ncbi:ankyrin repeat and SAM domain-containing protein 3-like isoform X2 [Zootermopsis nevadensis]|uniref:ankyrin repeat and SAM domain-containing protein 3-like isoform X2 n=1 Tax=Zootermopsis nevadensis TaxID=136037 RepID=UPI000B8E8780|nr:ankyrin repeat and SAM domain-containing protein 3-like isoform X2 [Zootermopsis nevadensis]